MSTATDLIKRALSTEYENEAISCLTAARKKGVKFEDISSPTPSSLYRGQGAEYWYNKA